MERTIFDLMSELKLFGMRSAYNDVIAVARAAANHRRSSSSRNHRKTGALDQISGDHRQALSGERYR